MVILVVLNTLFAGGFSLIPIIIRSVSIVIVFYIAEYLYKKTRHAIPWKLVAIAALVIIGAGIYSTGDYSAFRLLDRVVGIENFTGRLVPYSLSLLNATSEMLNSSSMSSGTSNYGGSSYSGYTAGCSVVTIEYNYASSENDSRAAIDYINKLREQNGKHDISFDERVFNLAVARAKDMRNYSYLDHINPYTGTCPDNMKASFGLSPTEYVAEDAFGNPTYSEGACTQIEMKSMTDAVDSWMTSRGHRYNLLYDDHIAGAVGCYKNMCTFLGLNHDGFGSGCHTAAEGQQFWATATKQPGET
jgi:uncharacterized protein YkwD